MVLKPVIFQSQGFPPCREVIPWASSSTEYKQEEKSSKSNAVAICHFPETHGQEGSKIMERNIASI
jgi:hypothetical protein